MSCARSHYAVIVEATKPVEIYQNGPDDCLDCLRIMVEKHEEISSVFRARLAKLLAEGRCRVYDTACINPSYCDARDACCAGDPDCRQEGS